MGKAFCVALFAAMLAGQSFDVASIRPSASASPGMRFDRTPDNGFRATGVTLQYLVRMAYDVEDFQVSGGPGWVRADRFDISANAADPVAGSPESFRKRLRALLASRFQLGVREEAKEGPVYFLEQAKGGSKMIPSESGSVQFGRNSFGRNRGLLTTDHASPAMLARTFSAILLRPVLDHTGLSGGFAFKLQWAEAGAPGEPEDSGVSLFTAVQEQLGLRLQPGRGPVPSVVIERAEKPSEN